MHNPFEQLDQRLSNIESLLNEIKSQLNPVSHQEPTEEILTVDQTAKFLTLTVATIYSKVTRGVLPVMKRGHRLYFSKQDLLEYLKQGKMKTNYEISQEADNYIHKKQK